MWIWQKQTVTAVSLDEEETKQVFLSRKMTDRDKIREEVYRRLGGYDRTLFERILITTSQADLFGKIFTLERNDRHLLRTRLKYCEDAPGAPYDFTIALDHGASAPFSGLLHFVAYLARHHLPRYDYGEVSKDEYETSATRINISFLSTELFEQKTTLQELL